MIYMCIMTSTGLHLKVMDKDWCTADDDLGQPWRIRVLPTQRDSEIHIPGMCGQKWGADRSFPPLSPRLMSQEGGRLLSKSSKFPAKSRSRCRTFEGCQLLQLLAIGELKFLPESPDESLCDQELAMVWRRHNGIAIDRVQKGRHQKRSFYAGDLQRL